MHLRGYRKNKKGYTPNHIPSAERISCLFFSIGLITYGTIGVYIDDLYVPGKRSRGLHFHGVPCWILYFAFLFAAINLLSVIMDHYDTRNNETNYRKFAKLTRQIGWILFWGALIIDLVIFHQSTR